MSELEKETLEQEEAVDTAEAVEESVEAEEAEADVEAAEAEEENEEAEGGNKKSIFGKKKEKDASAEKIAELEDKVKRQLAEFENFRNRSEREKQAMFETGAKSVIEKILPVVDNFERGFTTVEESDKDDAFVQGMQQVYKQLMTELESIGVTPIEAIGQEFNPDFHNLHMIWNAM